MNIQEVKIGEIFKIKGHPSNIIRRVISVDFKTEIIGYEIPERHRIKGLALYFNEIIILTKEEYPEYYL